MLNAKKEFTKQDRAQVGYVGGDSTCMSWVESAMDLALSLRLRWIQGYVSIFR